MLAVTVVAAQQTSVGEKLVKEGDCFSCHAQNGQSVGPSFAAIARRYAGQASSISQLSAQIRKGGSGDWGDVAMPPHPELTDSQAKQMLSWIFSLVVSPLFLWLLLRRLGVERWKQSVKEKLKTLDDIYRFVVEQVSISRGQFLEIVVVVILILELIPIFMGLLR